MKHLMRKCPRCGRYTLRENCPVCGSPTTSPHPPRYTPEDKYVRYRVLARRSIDESKNSAT
ncbi:MAG: RNA-protein complex protein Nop10 [Sulfolobales archaeon]